MFESADYELLDFANGRKLERFGPVTVDRPLPGSRGAASSRPGWQADARFEFHAAPNQRDQDVATANERGEWIPHGGLPKQWTIAFGPLRFELRPTEFGHLGIFPEQAENWDWIARQVEKGSGVISRLRDAHSTAEARELTPDPFSRSFSRLKVLNLFAHTGGSTLAAAAAGAEVIHVDSARGAVAWARRNAALSGLADAPIRWIVEDAGRFVRRERKRGNHYDAVILDPPSYGHGPKGAVWKIDRDLIELLGGCVALTEGRRRFILLTCHTPSITPAVAQQVLSEAFTFVAGDERGLLEPPTHEKQCPIVAAEMTILSATNQRLPCGVMVRWPE